jgi:hypothetical protein
MHIPYSKICAVGRITKPQLEFLSLSALKPSGYTNANAFDSPHFCLKPTRSPFMRLVALCGLISWSLAATLCAANTEADRFLETAKELIQAINSDDSAAIQASFNAQMQQAVPPDKATPFFRGLVTAKGKLKNAAVPQVTGPTAIMRVAAERGAWDFKITLEPSGKIAGLLITQSAAKAAVPTSSQQRFTKVTNKLIRAINSDDSAAIQASFDAQMQQALPREKATPFFCGLVTAKGKLKNAGAPQVTGPTAIVRVTAERGDWDFKISLEPSDKIAELLITEAAAEASAPASAQRFTKVVNKLIQAINSDDSAAIQASFDAQMQQALPADKATPFFRELVSAAGKLKNSGVPQITGPTAIVRVSAERGALEFKITLDASDKISGLYVTPSASGPAAGSTSDSPLREWRNATGKYRVNAELMGVKDGKVQLKKSDGKVINIPLAKLSAQDQDALKKLPPPAATK